MSYEYFAKIETTEGLLLKIHDWMKGIDQLELLPSSEIGRITARVTTNPQRDGWHEDIEIRVNPDEIYVAVGALDREARESFLIELTTYLERCGVRAQFIED